jgi:hypothetical protein
MRTKKKPRVNRILERLNDKSPSMRSIFTTIEGSRETPKLLENYTLENMALVISNTEEGIKKLQQYVQLGFTEIMVVNSSPDRKKLVKLLAQQISPAFKAEQ